MTPRQTLFSSVPPRNPLVSVSDPYWAFSSLQWRLSSALRLEPFVGTGSIEIDALATSTSYAGRRPLPWLACNVARATKLTCFHCSKYWGIRATLALPLRPP